MKIRVPRHLAFGGSPGPREAIGAPTEPAPESLLTPIRLEGPDLLKAFCEIATNAWKARGRLNGIAPDAQSTDHRRLTRNLDAILDALSTIQVQIKDHTGEAYDYGLPLRIVASEPRAGISREVVIETVRPTVLLADHILQRGEVVIAVPQDEQDGKS